MARPVAGRHSAALHEAGRLLPDSDDRLRDALERNARIIDSAAPSISAELALARRGSDFTASFGELVDARLHATVSGDEIWVAIATQASDGRFVDERLRDVLFRLVFDAADAELWEPRADWPSGELAWFQVARLGLRDAILYGASRVLSSSQPIPWPRRHRSAGPDGRRFQWSASAQLSC